MMFYLKKFVLTTEKGEKASLDLMPGLNIIHGPSNTGKSLIVDCVDFMYGGSPDKLIENPIKFKNVTLILDVDGMPLTLSRDINSNDILVSGNIEDIENGTYKASRSKKSIYQFWLRLMGITDDVYIVGKTDMSPQQLGVRTFIHTFLIKETRMSASNTVLKSGEGYSNNIPIPTIMSLIYLLAGITYTQGEKIKPEKIRDAENEAIKRFVDRSLSSIGRQKIEEMNIPEGEISPEELQCKIEEVKRSIAEAEHTIDALTQESRSIASDVIQIDQQITEAKVLRNRYKSLMTQYESDIKRLTFIAEGDLHMGLLPKLDHCPFCNGELSKEKEESCIEAAAAEVSKIELQIKDLLSAGEHLDEEIEELLKKKQEKENARKDLQKQIYVVLEPKLSELNSNLNGFRVALGKQKVAEIFDKVADSIYVEMEEALDNDETLNINVKGKIKEQLEGYYNDILPSILKEAGYEDFVKAVFDVETCDIKVNGVPKGVQGQGYSAYLNAVMAIALQEIMNQANLYKTNLLVMDSPILSLAEKRKPGEKMASEGMRAGLFKYMDEHTVGYQIIVVENDIPDIKYKNANLIEFTKDPSRGRYGLVESYHVN